MKKKAEQENAPTAVVRARANGIGRRAGRNAATAVQTNRRVSDKAPETLRAPVTTGDTMTMYQTIGPDRPFGDREGAEEDWSAERVEEISNDEVENPEQEPEHEPERDVKQSERKD
jgi:hypothetical protein